MALRDGNPFYFLFPLVDQAAIDETTIILSDIPYAANPQVTDPYPQSFRIQFSLKADKTGEQLRLRPLGPGLLSFHFDPQEGKEPPSEDNAIIENYDQWPTVGRLRLTITDPRVVNRIKEITGLPFGVTDVWYSNVRITSNFLFQSLRELPVSKVIADKKRSLDPKTAAGLRSVVSGFLKGKYFARLKSGGQASEDSQSDVGMPHLASAEPGKFDFYITTAYTRDPCDGEPREYQNPENVSDWEPAHPRYGNIPARLIYRDLRTHPTHGDMIGGGIGNPVPDRILASSATAGIPDYYPVRFTRIWLPREEYSVYFPSQVVTFTQVASGISKEQRLPAHGLLFIALTQVESEVGTDFSISIANPLGRRHEMRWLNADVEDVWLKPAANTPVVVPVPPPAQVWQQTPHIQLRRLMSQEIIYDRKDRPIGVGPSCTYFSLRRTVRALVNNRIAGGRLNFEVYYVGLGKRGKNKPETRDLVREALGEALGKDVAQAVLDGLPNHRAGENARDENEENAAIGAAALTLRPVLEKLFPLIAVSQITGVLDPDERKVGNVAYLVWQSAIEQFKDDNLKDLFADHWLGGGGAGALLAMELANEYTVKAERETGENDVSFRHRLVREMLSGRLKPGAALQFWEEFADLDLIRARKATKDKLTGVGHSPIFLRYIGPPASPQGMVVLDQGGEEECKRKQDANGNFILPWGGYEPDAWIATNWLE
jgi:hypothetical protein